MNQVTVIEQCKKTMLAILENDDDPVGSVAAAKSVWDYAVSWQARQPKPESLIEYLDDLRTAAFQLLDDLGGYENESSVKLDNVLRRYSPPCRAMILRSRGY